MDRRLLINTQIKDALRRQNFDADVFQGEDGKFRLDVWDGSRGNTYSYNITEEQARLFTHQQNNGYGGYRDKAWRTMALIMRNDFKDLPLSYSQLNNYGTMINNRDMTYAQANYRNMTMRGGIFRRPGPFGGGPDMRGWDPHHFGWGRGMAPPLFGIVHTRPYSYGYGGEVYGDDVYENRPGAVKPGTGRITPKENSDRAVQSQRPTVNATVVRRREERLEPQNGEAIPLSESVKDGKFDEEKFLQVLSSHGITLKNNMYKPTLEVYSAKEGGKITYEISREQAGRLLARDPDQKDFSIQDRLDTINEIIAGDWEEKVTKETLESKDPLALTATVSAKDVLKNVREENMRQDLAFGAEMGTRNQLGAVQKVSGARVDERSGRFSGVVDGKLYQGAMVDGGKLEELKATKSFYTSERHGREVQVGTVFVSKITTLPQERENNPSQEESEANLKGTENQQEQTPKAGKINYTMTAMIDGQEVTRSINASTYEKFMAVDDYHRLKMFDKVFDEVDMKLNEYGKEKRAETWAGIGTGALIGVAAALGVAGIIKMPAPPMLDYAERRPRGREGVYSLPGSPYTAGVSPGKVNSNIDAISGDLANTLASSGRTFDELSAGMDHKGETENESLSRGGRT